MATAKFKTYVFNFDKSPLDSDAVFTIVFLFLGASFFNISCCSLPPPPPLPPILYNIETWLYASNLVCGVGGGDGHAELKNAPPMLMCPKTFAHHCRCQCQVNYIVCNVRI